MKSRIVTALVMSLCVLSACTPGMNAAVQTLQKAVQKDTGPARTRLDPKFKYLRVTIDSRLVFLASADVDRHPDGPVEIWYSATREVVRLQNGRIVGVTGLKSEWRNVSIREAPTWAAAARQKSVRWVRTRDVMPGYRYGMNDELLLQVVPVPARSKLAGIDPRTLVWFEERMERNSEKTFLPPALYGVDLSGGKEIVVYAEQCIAADICFSWQRWSAAQQSEATKGLGSAK